MKNKKLWIAVIALVAVVGIMAGVWFATRPQTQEGTKAITVVVTHKNGDVKEFTYRTDAEYLDEVLVEAGLVTGSESQYGLTVESVDGETADWNVDSAYWQIFVGEEAAATGISGIVVEDGAVYQFKYTMFTGE